MSNVSDSRFFVETNIADGFDAYIAALSALFEPNNPEPSWYQRIRLWERGSRGDEVEHKVASLEEMIALVEAHLTPGKGVTARVPVRVPTEGSVLSLLLSCSVSEGQQGARSVDGFELSSGFTYFMSRDIDVPVSHKDLPIEVGAALIAYRDQRDMESLLVRLCAPDARSLVKVGGYTMLDTDDVPVEVYNWLAPLEMAASYNGDLHVARDVALSWLYLYEDEYIGKLASVSLDVLTARVEAAPTGAAIGLATSTEDVINHYVHYQQVLLDRSNNGNDGQSPRSIIPASRQRLPKDDELTREQVLATLQMPPETLLEALEAAAAVPDEDWRNAEKLAREVIEIKKQGEPIEAINADTYSHRCFLAEHAPYHIRRLPNGGVMLATHPYRHLWPLWSKALDLLGIRPKTA